MNKIQLYLKPMDKELLTLVEESGFIKKHIAYSIGVSPNHLYLCMAGKRMLSRKKEAKLRSFLSQSLQLN